MLAPIRRIGLIGAESSGKTTLAQALATELNDRGITAAVVPEFLRTWCEIHERTPLLSEQPDIVQGQIDAEDRAAAENPGAILICDPATVMTELYSHLYFGQKIDFDPELAQRYAQFVWCDIDIEWVPDPLRDGQQFRDRIHEAITLHSDQLQVASGAGIQLVGGSVGERIQRVLPSIIGRRGNPISS